MIFSNFFATSGLGSYVRSCFNLRIFLSGVKNNQFHRKMYSSIERGSLHTPNYRLYFTDGNGPISPFHDIPVYADKENRIYHMVVEVPRWTNAKMEIATKEPLNPIKQDTKKGALRYVHNVFPHHGYIWNYGALPQTWEDPNHIDDATKCKGDNDPIDVCEIGYRVAQRGEVLQVKILGCIALIDEGETDWKLLAIDIEDPLADELNDIEDIETHMPGLLAATNEWFRIYKMPAGNPENKFAFGGEPKNRDFAEQIVEETHRYWQKLVSNPNDSSGLSCVSVTVDNSPYSIGVVEASSIIDSSPECGSQGTIDSIVDKWHFVKLKQLADA